MAEEVSVLLHAVRLLGFADAAAIAASLGGDSAGEESGGNASTGQDYTGQGGGLVTEALLDAESRGWVQHTAFGDLGGWSLTERGRVENERLLAEERQEADPGGEVAAVYREFFPCNARLLRACTDWQLRPTGTDALAPNDHRDPVWDQRVLAELAALSRELVPLVARLRAVLPRFGGYDERFATALGRAQAGEHDWADRLDVDSCHRVWFELHEDLVATLGIDRSAVH